MTYQTNLLLKRVDAIVSGELTSVPLPWQVLSRLCDGVIPGTVVLLCGDPSASKSLMLMQAFLHWFSEGYIVAMYALENDREFHLLRALAQKTSQPGITSYNWIRANSDYAKDLLKSNSDFLEEFGGRIWVVPDTPPTTAQVVQWTKERAITGCRIIAIDPLTMMTYTAKNQWEEDKVFLSEIGKIAAEYKCTVILVTHPIKNRPNLHYGVSPDISALSGGAAYSRFSDTILWMQRHEDVTKPVMTVCGKTDMTFNRTLHVLKSRSGNASGMRLAMQFKPETLMLSECGVILKTVKE